MLDALPPLALSDLQVTTVMQLARPLAPNQRAAFLEMLAARLNGRRRDVGDGELHRMVRTIIRDHHLFDAPLETEKGERARGGKYA
jgi:hypothetical protein